MRSEEFLGGSSGSVMSWRLGMLTTMRLWAACRGDTLREAIFSTVGLLGLASIPLILGRRGREVTETVGGEGSGV